MLLKLARRRTVEGATRRLPRAASTTSDSCLSPLQVLRTCTRALTRRKRLRATGAVRGVKRVTRTALAPKASAKAAAPAPVALVDTWSEDGYSLKFPMLTSEDHSTPPSVEVM